MAGALAVKSQLRSRGIQVDPTCTLCGQERETICHMLFHCPSSNAVWERSGLPLPPAGFSTSSNFLNLHYLLSCSKKSSLDPMTRLAFPWVLWQIWKKRNLVCFEHRRNDAETIWTKAIEEAEVWLQLNSFIPSSVPEIHFVKKDNPAWMKPPQGMLKCNVGSAWSGTSENAGAAWITRDCTGTPLFHSRRSLVGIRSQIEADMQALVWSTEALYDFKVEKVIIEISASCLPAVLSLASIPRIHHHLLRRVFRVLESFEVVYLALVHQESNTVAEGIARSALQHRLHQSYVARSGPRWLNSQVLLDASSDLPSISVTGSQD